MKKRLPIIMNEKGFYLPYVIIVSLITLSIMTTSIMVYHHELKNTHTFIEQIEVETLIQMARAKFIEEAMYKGKSNGQVNYEFPNGIVKITYESRTEETMHLFFHVVSNGNTSYEIMHELTIEQEQ